MNAAPGPSFGWIAAGLVASAVGSLFAAGDGALVGLAEPRLQSLAEQTGPVGDAFRRFIAGRQRILSRWLVCRIVATSLAAVLYSRVADAILDWTPLHDSPALGMLAAALCAVLTYGTFSEVLLALARRRPERVGSLALRFLVPVEWAAVPLADPLSALGRFIGQMVTIAPKSDTDARLTETEVEWVVRQGERSGALANEPAEMIRNVLDFKDLTAREVMVPRRRISSLEVSTSLERVVAIVSADGHSRYPVYRETLDNVVGLLYAKDLFTVVKEKRLAATKLVDIVRSPVLFVVETQSILSMPRDALPPPAHGGRERRVRRNGGPGDARGRHRGDRR